MTRRARSIRFVFIVAILTTIATSPAQPNIREATSTRSFSNLLRVRIVFSAAASEQAERMHVVLHWQGEPAMLVPDDPLIPVVQLEDFQEFEARDLCLEAGPCELAYTLDVGEGDGTLQVDAFAERAADSSFCFPENRDFSDDATVEVILE